MRDSDPGYHTRGAVDAAAPVTVPCPPDGASVPDPERRRPSRRAPETRRCAPSEFICIVTVASGSVSERGVAVRAAADHPSSIAWQIGW